MTSTVNRTIDYSEWSGTEEMQREFQFVERAEYPPFQIRIVNDLDVSITLDVRLTDSMDGARSRLADPLFYTNSKTVGWPPRGASPGRRIRHRRLQSPAGHTKRMQCPQAGISYSTA